MEGESFLDMFHRLTSIGWTPETGVNRLALNKYDIEARNNFVRELTSAKADISVDDAGLIFGSVGSGKDNIAIGSHMDSVPNGGRFDGFYGVMAALQMVKEFSGNTGRKRITAIDFTNEEGARFQPSLLGSGMSTGVFSREFTYSRKDKDGTTFEDALKSSGYMGNSENRVTKQLFSRFIELHIEQGPVLELGKYQIGIPKGIVTLIINNIEFTGESNQAGPTPMEARKDALVAASRFIVEVRNLAKLSGKDVVMTVGKLDNYPNAYNVIPGKVKLNLDTRSPDIKTAEEYSALAKEISRKIADEEGVAVNFEKQWTTETTLFDEDLQKDIEKACIELNLKYKYLYSWAGHDAQYMNRVVPTAMIFIPSHLGRSHTKEEYSSDNDLLNGLAVLRKTVQNL
ncbi:MAG: M20 family metallo-hydrolase [Nitrososphaeria archaeon]